MAKEKFDPRVIHGERVIALVEEQIALGAAGRVPWHKTWDGDNGIPRNLNTGKAYRGSNLFFLSILGSAFDMPHWLTFKQAIARGGVPAKDEKSMPVVYWDFSHKRTNKDTGKEETIPFCRYSNVFNVRQCVPLEPERAAAFAAKGNKVGKPESWVKLVAKLEAAQASVERTHDPIEAAQAIHERYAANGGPKLTHGGGRAAYSPSRDAICMPPLGTFETPAAYHTTRFHEETHSTGHKDRLARKELEEIGMSPESYSREELTAELGATMLASMAGIERETVDNSVAYLRGWLSRLKNDPKMLYAAATDAQKATDLILGTTFEKESSPESEASSEAIEKPKAAPKRAAKGRKKGKVA